MFTADQINLPANITAKAGEVVRFNALREFIEVTTLTTLGGNSGILFRVNVDGTFSRVAG